MFIKKNIPKIDKCMEIAGKTKTMTYTRKLPPLNCLRGKFRYSSINRFRQSTSRKKYAPRNNLYLKSGQLHFYDLTVADISFPPDTDQVNAPVKFAQIHFHPAAGDLLFQNRFAFHVGDEDILAGR